MFAEREKTVLYIGSDHAGYQAKGVLHNWLIGKGYEVTDLGCFTEESCDYPDIAREVSEKVLEREGSFGILFCGTGEGMAMAANKLKGIRAALCTNVELAEMARRHNNANVLTLGARTTEMDMMKSIVDKFLSTDFENEDRHQRRVQKMDEIGHTTDKA